MSNNPVDDAMKDGGTFGEHTTEFSDDSTASAPPVIEFYELPPDYLFTISGDVIFRKLRNSASGEGLAQSTETGKIHGFALLKPIQPINYEK